MEQMIETPHGRYTNRLGLDPDLVRVLTEPDYDFEHRPGAYSATEFGDAPGYVMLRRRHGPEIVRDVSDEASRFIGTATHFYIEHRLRRQGTEGEIEKRLELPIPVDGGGVVTISGKGDLWKDGVIHDWKTASVWKVIYEDFEDWTFQLNVYAYLNAVVAGRETNRLEVTAFLKHYEWRKKYLDSSYPQHEMHKQSLPLWPLEETRRRIEVRAAELHRLENVPDPSLPVCTPKQRWEKPTRYAVHKVNRGKVNKNAMPGGGPNNHETRESAEAFAAKQTVDTVVQERPGERTRCHPHWCKFRQWCPLRGRAELMIGPYYAIRHKPTGGFLPGGRRRGFTHDEPLPPSEGPPRLFRSEHAAKCALAWWLKGAWYVVVKYGAPTPVSDDEDSYEDWNCKEKQDRARKDMEIVPIYLYAGEQT